MFALRSSLFDNSHILRAKAGGTQPNAKILARSSGNQSLYHKTRTRFTRKNPIKMKKKAEASAQGLKGRDRKYAEWEQYSSVLNPRVVRPERTAAELEEAKKMSDMWRVRQMQRDRAFHRDEQRLLKIKELAMAEVPEEFRESAYKPDESLIHPKFIMAQIHLPLVGEVLFGDCQLLKSRSWVDPNGTAPYLPRPSKYTL